MAYKNEPSYISNGEVILLEKLSKYILTQMKAIKIYFIRTTFHVIFHHFQVLSVITNIIITNITST